MRICKNNECINEFSPNHANQQYCSDQCKRREAYSISKETGWRSKLTKIKFKTVCEYDKCGQEFETSNKNKRFCCRNHAKYANMIHKKNGGARKYTKHLKERKLVCGFSQCDNTFKTRSYQQKYCSDKCSHGAELEKNRLRQRRIRNSTKTYTSHKELLNTKQKREKRFEIKNFSAKWIQELYDARVTA